MDKGIFYGNQTFGRGSLRRDWTQQKIADTFLFYGEVSKITGGKLYNQVKGSSDYLVVGGSAGSETYQAPDNATYKTADTDYIWFKTDGTQRTTTTAELIGYDLQRTPVKYLDDSPNTIEVIAILKTGVSVTGTLRDQIFKLLHLSQFWDNSENIYGYVKSNRSGAQTLWNYEPVIPTGLTLSLIANGVKVDWTDNTGGLNETEIWGQSDGADYALLWTIAAGTVTKSEDVSPVDLRYYKVRTKNVDKYSDYTAPVSIAMLGPELVTDPNFANTALWTKAANWNISGGKAIHTTGATDNMVLTTPPASGNINGRKYRVKVNFLVADTNTKFYLDANTSVAATGAGMKTSIMTCTTTTEYYGFRSSVNTEIDYYSIKLVLE